MLTHRVAEKRRSLSESVADSIRETGFPKEFFNSSIELGASYTEKCDSATKAFLSFIPIMRHISLL